MVQLNQTFDSSTVKDNDLLPVGTYTLAITKTDSKPTKKDPANIIYTLEMDVQEGTFMGRKVFTGLNLVNSNDQAKAIAERELKRIVEACGKTAIRDLDELVGIPFLAEVVVDASKDPQFSDKNKVKKYMPKGAATVTAPTPAAGPWAGK